MQGLRLVGDFGEDEAVGGLGFGESAGLLKFQAGFQGLIEREFHCSTLRQLPLATQGPFDGDEEDEQPRPGWAGRGQRASGVDGRAGRGRIGGNRPRGWCVAEERWIADRHG